jgi:hypothetical protein
MNVKHGAQGFSTPPGPTKGSQRHFPLQPICAGRKEVVIIVGHFTFLVSVVDHQRAATRKTIKINPPGETICIALKLLDEKK